MKLLIKTVIFDVDSTLCTIEGIDELARLKSVEKEIIPLTNKAMNGEISLEEIFAKRLEIIKPSLSDMVRLSRLYSQNISPNAEEIIAYLKERNIEIYLVSGGYKQAILPLASKLNISERNVYANELYFDSVGSYQGFNKTIPLWKEKGKAKLIQTLNLERKTIFVGDGMSDLEAINEVDVFVGYGGVSVRKKVRQTALYYIMDLNELKLIIGS